MGEFFRGWRRKTGLITLAMAFALFILWMRSYVVRDQINLMYYRDDVYSLRSDKAAIRIVYRSPIAMDSMIDEEETFIYPYWSLVLPLTALSAWLILVKLRTPNHLPKI